MAERAEVYQPGQRHTHNSTSYPTGTGARSSRKRLNMETPPAQRCHVFAMSVESKQALWLAPDRYRRLHQPGYGCSSSNGGRNIALLYICMQGTCRGLVLMRRTRSYGMLHTDCHPEHSLPVLELQAIWRIGGLCCRRLPFHKT